MPWAQTHQIYAIFALISLYTNRETAQRRKKINHVANDKAGKGQYKKFSRSYDI